MGILGGASRVGNGENPGSLSNVAHEKGLFLKDSFPVGISNFSGTMLKFQGAYGILLNMCLRRFVLQCIQ